MGQQLDLSSHQNQGIYGRVTISIDYDYGSGVPGGILRQTATSYEFQSYGSYLDSNLLDLPASVVTSNGAGYKCAQTDFGYDDSSRTFASGVSHHGLSPPGTVRGNLTAITRQLGSMPCQSGGTWTPVASYQNVYDTGEVYQTIDPLGHTTTLTYDTTGTYVVKSQLPDTNSPSYAQHITQDSYDTNSGLRTSHTDESGNLTSYSYDEMWRIWTVTYPQGGGTATYSY